MTYLTKLKYADAAEHLPAHGELIQDGDGEKPLATVCKIHVDTAEELARLKQLIKTANEANS
jgi:hypothetical protein